MNDASSCLGLLLLHPIENQHGISLVCSSNQIYDTNLAQKDGTAGGGATTGSDSEKKCDVTRIVFVVNTGLN